MKKKQIDAIRSLLIIIFYVIGGLLWFTIFEQNVIAMFVIIIIASTIPRILTSYIPTKNKKTAKRKDNSIPIKQTSVNTSSNVNKEDKHYLLKADIQSLNGDEFEQLCMMYFEDIGYKPKWIGKSGDHGVDLIVKDPKDGLQMAVQCKRYKVGSNIGNADLIKLEGGKRFYKTPGTFFITTSNYTKHAKEFAQETGMKAWNGLHVQEYIGKWRTEKLKKLT
ncbi:restriction endonuclease [Paraliobacillus sp. X-1268]|uniref:restriction endonuclease n=1 Tax=Paraliobacillus sp. X-1268 TaxID=2213193 RepID=UPI000E3D6D6A|nr:restriction endonuclease [Paraliobacillus sp. X-1268]